MQVPSFDHPDTGRLIPTAAVLTGGRATRMGSDKAALQLDGETLLQHVVARVERVARRVVAVGGATEGKPAGLEVVPDRHPGADSLGGIATALAYAAERSREPLWVLVVACDMPFVEAALLRYLYGLREGYDIVVPRTEPGFEPLCALYRTTSLGAFMAQLREGNLRIRDVFRRVRTREVSAGECRRADPELLSFVNINRPDDLERARDLLRGEPAARAV